MSVVVVVGGVRVWSRGRHHFSFIFFQEKEKEKVFSFIFIYFLNERERHGAVCSVYIFLIYTKREE